MKEIPQKVLAFYEVFRTRVNEEDNLVNHRMTWMIGANAIFFGYFAGIKLNIAASSSVPRWDVLPAFFPIFFGLYCTDKSWISINAALCEIDHLKKIYYFNRWSIREAEGDGLIPGLVGHKDNDIKGRTVPFGMASSLTVLWLILYVWTILGQIGLVS